MSTLNVNGKYAVGIIAILNLSLELYIEIFYTSKLNSPIYLFSILVSILFYYGLYIGKSWIRWLIVIEAAGKIILSGGLLLLGSIIALPISLGAIDLIFVLIISLATFICLTLVTPIRDFFEDVNNNF